MEVSLWLFPFCLPLRERFSRCLRTSCSGSIETLIEPPEMRSNCTRTMKILLLLVLLSTNTSACVSVWDFLNFADDSWELRAAEEEVEPVPVLTSFNA
jgi:hypothetical protein